MQCRVENQLPFRREGPSFLFVQISDVSRPFLHFLTPRSPLNDLSDLTRDIRLRLGSLVALSNRNGTSRMFDEGPQH